MSPRRSIAARVALAVLALFFSQPPAAAAQESPEPGREPERTAQTQPKITPPRAAAALEVVYPNGASGYGTVELELLIDEAGNVVAVEARDGEAPFVEAAQAAARTWRYHPATRGGTPVAARIRVEIIFEPPVADPVEVTLERADGDSAPNEAVVEVVVQGQRAAKAAPRLSRSEVRQLPGAFGDPFRAIEPLPGVTPIVSGLPYFYVRGAPPGNVGYFLDLIPLPVLYHAAVGPGVIHPAFIEDVQLFAGGYPARYGRYAGGIVAATSREPSGRFGGEASVRLVDSGAMVELPFTEGKGNAMLAGRYSYTGLVVSLLVPEVQLGYWDYQARVNYLITPVDQLSVFAFGSHDYLGSEGSNGSEPLFDVTFHRARLRWDRQLSERSASQLSAVLSRDETLAGEGLRVSARGVSAFWTYQRDWDDRRLQLGADVGFKRFDAHLSFDNDAPTAAVQLEDDQEEEDPNEATLRGLFATRDDIIGGVWADLSLFGAARLSVTPGLRLDFYRTGDDFVVAPEPRVEARFHINAALDVVHRLGLAHQPPSFPVPIPGLEAGTQSGLQRSLQSSAGVEAELPYGLSGSATVFHNLLFAGTDVLSVSQLSGVDESVEVTERVLGRSLGLELYLRRPMRSRWGGFIAYTLSRAQRAVGRVSGPSAFDRTHVLNVAGSYQLGVGWQVGGRFSTYSGIPARVAYARAASDPPRTPPFWRLDARLEKRWALDTPGTFWALVLEVLNTTLNEEVVDSSCYAHGCQHQPIGPVTVPSLGVEARF